MASTSDRSVYEQVKDRWINPLYREGIGRRTGRQINVNAHRNSEGFENFSDYWSDQSTVDSDISEVIDKENDMSKVTVDGRVKNGEVTARKSSPLKSMQSFASSGKSSEPSSSTVRIPSVNSSGDHGNTEPETESSSKDTQDDDVQHNQSTAISDTEEGGIDTKDGTEDEDIGENNKGTEDTGDEEENGTEEKKDPKQKTPDQQVSLNEADITGSIISVQTSKAPNSALQSFRTKKRLSFSFKEAESIKKAKKQDVSKKPTRQSSRKSTTEEPSKEVQDKETEGQDETTNETDDELNDTVTESQSGSDTPVKKSSSSEEEKESTVKKRPRRSPRKSTANDTNEGDNQTSNTTTESEQTQVIKSQEEIKEKSPKVARTKRGRASAILQESVNDSPAENANFITLQKSQLQTLPKGIDQEDEDVDADDVDNEEDGFEIVEDTSPIVVRKSPVKRDQKATKRKSQLDSQENDKDSKKVMRKTRSQDTVTEKSLDGEDMPPGQPEEENEDNEENANKQTRTRGRKGKKDKLASKNKPTRQSKKGQKVIIEDGKKGQKVITEEKEEVVEKVTRKSSRRKRTSEAPEKIDAHEEDNVEEDEKEEEQVEKQPVRQSRRRKDKTRSDEDPVPKEHLEDEKEVKKGKGGKSRRGSRKEKVQSEDEEETSNKMEEVEDPQEELDPAEPDDPTSEDEEVDGEEQEGFDSIRMSQSRSTSSPAKVFELVKLVSPAPLSLHEEKEKQRLETEQNEQSPSPAQQGKGKKRRSTFTASESPAKAKKSSGSDTDSKGARSKGRGRKGSKSGVAEDKESQGGEVELHDKDSNVADDDAQDISNSIVIQPTDSNRLSWEKAPSELSPINIDPYLFDNSEHDDKPTKSKGNKGKASKAAKRKKGQTWGRKKGKNKKKEIEDTDENDNEEVESQGQDLSQDIEPRRRAKKSSEGEEIVPRSRSRESSGNSEEVTKGRSRKSSTEEEQPKRRIRKGNKKEDLSQRDNIEEEQRNSGEDQPRRRKRKGGKKKEDVSQTNKIEEEQNISGEDSEEAVESRLAMEGSGDTNDDVTNSRSRKSKKDTKEGVPNKQSRKGKNRVEESDRTSEGEDIEEGVSKSRSRKGRNSVKERDRTSEGEDIEEGESKSRSRKGNSDIEHESSGGSRHDSDDDTERNGSRESSRDMGEDEGSGRSRSSGKEASVSRRQSRESAWDTEEEAPGGQLDDIEEDEGPTPSCSTDPTPSHYPTPKSILRKAGKKTGNGNNRRLTLQFFEEPRKKGYLVKPRRSVTEGVRRTKRTRIQTLEYWRNERPLYERRKSGGFALVGVMSPTTNSPAPRKKRQTLPKKRVIDCATPSNVSMHVTPPARAAKIPHKAVTVINPETEEEVEIDAIVTSKMNKYVGPSGKVAEPEDPITVCKCLHQPAFSSGVLKVRPLKEKSTQLVKRNTMVFFIIKGKLAVTIHNTTQILQTGDSFFVPQGNVYNIRNMRRDEAKLNFFQLKNG